jgi:hypothetical protein
MSKRLVQAIENYETMLRLQSAGRLSEQQIEQRVLRYRTCMAAEAASIAGTRPILCDHGISVLEFAMYYAYSREVGKLKRQGWTLSKMQVELRPKVMKWALRGLDEAVLKEIAATVYLLPFPDLTEEEVNTDTRQTMIDR